MALPTIILYAGLDKDVTFNGPGVSEFDFSAYATTEFRCPGLSITKSTSSASQAEVLNGGKDLKVILNDSDFTDAEPTRYEYQLVVSEGSREFDVGGCWCLGPSGYGFVKRAVRARIYGI